MVDIHTHVLHGLDDGPKALETSLRMLRIAAANGTTDIVATPHANLRYGYDSQVVSARIAELKSANQEAIEVHRGCDFHLTIDNVRACLKDTRKYSINGQGYLLVEFSPEMIPPNTEAILQTMTQAGLSPVITHPERNPLLRRRLDLLEQWVERGFYTQVTAQSLLGTFGQSPLRSVRELLERGLVHIVASDAHDETQRPPILKPAYDYVASEWGTATAEALFVENPRRTLRGEPMLLVPAGKPVQSKGSFVDRLCSWTRR